MPDEPKYDIEEPAEVLEADDPRPWLGEHRKVLFSTIDYTLGELAEQADEGDLDLQPQYQRRLRWSAERQSRLIESFLMNVPIPPIFLSEESDGKYAVIDGKQRITAITDFVRRGLELVGLQYFSDLNGSTFDSLPRTDRNFFSKRIPIRAVIILESSPEDIRLETFKRLNTGGVQLNAQEIRNIAFRGPLNDLIMELSELEQFHRLLKIAEPEKSAVHQQMRDAELVLRFFAFHTNWRSFSGSIKGHMDDYMATNRNLPEAGIEKLRSHFMETLAVVEAAFGEHAFARYQPEKGQWRHQVVAAIYDAEMLAAQSRSVEVARRQRSKVVGEMQRLFARTRFREATEAATNATTSFKYRIGAVSRVLNAALKD